MENVKQPQDHKKSTKGKKAKAVTSASDWKKGKSGLPLEVPSGNTALVRTPGMEVFLKEGLIPNSLLPIIQKAIAEKKPADMDELELTAETLEQLMSMVDAITVYCVIEPAVNPLPLTEDNEPANRDEDVLYVDEIDLQDKLFIFQFAIGGTRDLEKFRDQQDAALGTVPTISGLPFQPEPAAQD